MSVQSSCEKNKKITVGKAFGAFLILVLAALTAVYIFAVMSMDAAVGVYIDGVKVGYVESPASVRGRVRLLESELSEASGTKYQLSGRVSYAVVNTFNPTFMSYEEITAAFDAAAGRDFCDAYMLYVDGQRAGAFTDRDALEGLIDDIEASILDRGGDIYDDVKILNNLKIVEQPCLRSTVLTLDEINKLINPLESGNDGDVSLMSAADAYAEEPDEDVNVLRITAFSALSPEDEAVLDNADPEAIIDPDIDYGVIRSAAPESDFTLSYSFIRTETVNEVIPREVDVTDDEERYEGDDTVVDEGADGLRTVKYEISCDENGVEVSRRELSSVTLVYPETRVVIRGAKIKPPAEPTGTFIWPCDTSKDVSSGYGGRDLYGHYDFHLGIDIPNAEGTPIYAADGGEVVWAGFTPSYGNHVRIQHDGDLVTLYAHMKELNVSVGDKVFQGQQIGIMGHTGAAYGNHLHFEVRHGTKTTDPMKYLPEIDIVVWS